jgi:hypothetical protein
MVPVGDDVRPDVLDRARAEYVELMARMHQDVVRLLEDLDLNRAERLRLVVDVACAAVDGLQDVGALREARGLLDMTRHEVDQLVDRGSG